MKRLTAGIFAVLMGLVSVNVADAAVTSEAYVKQELAKKQPVLTQENAAGTNVTISSDHKINVETTNTAAAGSIVPASAGLVHTVMTDAATARSGLDTRITANETAVSNLQSGKADKGTKLSDYGITDAYTKGETDTAIAEAVKGTMEGDVSAALGDYLKKTEAETIYETIAAAQEINTAQTTKIDANTAAVATLNGNESVDGSVAKKIADAVSAMTRADTAVNGQFVTVVSQSNGQISVERRSLLQSDIPTIKLEQVGINDGTAWRTLMDMLSADSQGSVQLLSTEDGLKNLVIRNGAITSNMIADGAVGTKQLADGAVTSEKISAGAVGENALGENAVTGDKIKNGVVDANKLAEAVQNQLNGALQAPKSYEASDAGTLVLTAVPDGKGGYTYAWEAISGR